MQINMNRTVHRPNQTLAFEATIIAKPDPIEDGENGKPTGHDVQRNPCHIIQRQCIYHYQKENENDVRHPLAHGHLEGGMLMRFGKTLLIHQMHQ